MQRIELVRSFKESASGAEAQILPESSDAEVVCLICSEQCFMDFFKFASKFYERELSRATDVFDVRLFKSIDSDSKIFGHSECISVLIIAGTQIDAFGWYRLH